MQKLLNIANSFIIQFFNLKIDFERDLVTVGVILNIMDYEYTKIKLE
jgi:hypothetical protein